MNFEKELQIIANLKAGRHWSELAPALGKDEKIPMTEEYFYKTLAMDNELIHEMLAEIASLKTKVNRLEQKLASKKNGWLALKNLKLDG